MIKLIYLWFPFNHFCGNYVNAVSFIKAHLILVFEYIRILRTVHTIYKFYPYQFGVLKCIYGVYEALWGYQLFTMWSLGALNTRANRCDHEIVRVQKKVSKGCPKAPPNSCSVKSYITGPSTKCYFNEFLLMRLLTDDEIEEINRFEFLECIGLSVLC
jgi:hypothetical protein